MAKVGKDPSIDELPLLLDPRLATGQGPLLFLI